jgi:hypothetical protein
MIGSFPALSLADARREWRNHRATRHKHGDPRDEVRRRRDAQVAGPEGKALGGNRRATSQTRARETLRSERRDRHNRHVKRMVTINVLVFAYWGAR